MKLNTLFGRDKLTKLYVMPHLFYDGFVVIRSDFPENVYVFLQLIQF